MDRATLIQQLQLRAIASNAVAPAVAAYNTTHPHRTEPHFLLLSLRDAIGQAVLGAVLDRLEEHGALANPPGIVEWEWGVQDEQGWVDPIAMGESNARQSADYRRQELGQRWTVVHRTVTTGPWKEAPPRAAP